MRFTHMSQITINKTYSKSDKDLAGILVQVKKNEKILRERAQQLLINKNPSSILIDDKKSNIKEWNDSNGIAIRCKDGDISPVIEQLKTLGYE